MSENPEPPETEISPDFPFTLHTVDVLGSQMTYIDTQPDAKAENEPVALFIHGNPTSSYLWRNVIPHVSPLMRCVAPDLIGMGNSSKPANLQYRFTDHHTFLSTFIQAVIPSGPVLLVVHDWGSALGLHWARQQAELSASDRPPRVLGIALMEFLRPFPSWEDFSANPRVQEVFKAYRSPQTGREFVINNNAFVENSLPRGIVRPLTAVEHDMYRRPFLRPVDREPVYAWPNQIPIDHHPADVYHIATRYHDWLMMTEVPKLLFWATPGLFVTEQKAHWYVRNLKATTAVYLGEGLHFLLEDHPRKIGTSIRDWAVDVLLPKTS